MRVRYVIAFLIEFVHFEIISIKGVYNFFVGDFNDVQGFFDMQVSFFSVKEAVVVVKTVCDVTGLLDFKKKSAFANTVDGPGSM